MNYEKEYQEEVKILNDIYKRYDNLSEEDIEIGRASCRERVSSPV